MGQLRNEESKKKREYIGVISSRRVEKFTT